MIKVALACDNCGALIADGISANEVRLQAEALYRRRDGKDLCLACGGPRWLRRPRRPIIKVRQRRPRRRA